MNFFKNIKNQFCKSIKLTFLLLHGMSKKTKYFCITNFVLALVIILLEFFVITFSNPIPTMFATIIHIFALFVYFFTVLFSIYQSCKLQYITQNLEKSNLYNHSLRTLHDDVRAFKHDFGNIIQAIGGYITNNDMPGLKTYYSQLFADCQNLNNLYALNPNVINSPAIYSILSSKYNRAIELGITIHFNIYLNLEELHMKIYEFSRILGILMDNAIEASFECEEKIITVEMRNDSKRNRQLLIIENTYSEKNIDLDGIFQKGFSSKPHNTGLGLWEVRQILKKHKNLNLYTSQDGHFFKQQLEIYHTAKKTTLKTLT